MADNYLNNTGLAYYHNRIKTIFTSKTDFDVLDGKVDGLIAEGGEPNVIEAVKVNGTALPVTAKAVDVTVPTKTSELTNDSKYQTDTEVQGLIDDALKDVTSFEYQVVATLPATGEKGTIYLVGTQSPYDEYVWIAPTGGTAHWEQIGTSEVDLSGYWAKADLVAITTAQIDGLFA